MKHHLNNYFDKSREALVGGVGVDQELCLLCTQCFEVTALSYLCMFPIAGNCGLLNFAHSRACNAILKRTRLLICT